MKEQCMRNVLRIGVILGIVAALVVGGALVLGLPGRRAAAEATPSTVIVARGSVEEIVSATGNVVADQEATLGFATSGEIAEVLVAKGQQVKAGQVLARLDITSLEWQVARSQASLASAQARLAQAQKPATADDLASAQAALDSARSNYETVKEGASAEDLASARAALDSARRNFESVKAGPTEEDLAAARAQLDSARAALRQAQAAYDRVKDRPDIQMRQEALNLENATISLDQAQANYDALANRPTESELASAQAQVAQAEASLATLLHRPSASELASAQAQVAQAEANFASLQARPNAEDVAVQQAAVEEAALALEQAGAQLEDALITAPFAGTILAVSITQGEWGSPGAPVMTLAATRPMVLAVNVDEVDVAQLAERQEAHLSFDALRGVEEDGAAGTVTYIAPSATNVGGAVAYAVEIAFDPGPLPVRLGMTADVEVVVARAEDALLVPNRAIEADRQAGRYYVNRLRSDGSAERLEVRIGLRDKTQTEILEGLAEGDTLVLPTVPEQGSETGPAMPFGGAGQDMRRMGEGN
jgi:HlyD family secretion protein